MPRTVADDPRALLVAVLKRNPNVPQMAFIEEDLEGVSIEELKGGYGNYTYRIRSHDLTKSVVLKHGKDYFKVFSDKAAPLKRREVEYETMKRLDNASPGSCPKPYLLDMVDNIIIMEDLGHLTLLGELTQRGEVDIDTMKALGSQLAGLHQSTTKKNTTQETWQQLQTTFGPVPSYVKDFYFVEVLDPGAQSLALVGEMNVAHELLTSSPALLARLAALRTHMDTEQCLIHSDNHHNSVFFGQGRCALFDLEGVGLSAPEANVGTVPFWFLCVLHVLPASDKKNRMRIKFRAATKAFIDAYLFDSPDLQDTAALATFVSYTTAYLCALTFRIIACPGVDQFFHSTHVQRAGLMRRMLGILEDVSHVTTPEQLLDSVFYSD